MAALERQETEEAMKEGYLAARRDRDELDAAWRVTETEGWPSDRAFGPGG